MCHGDPDGADKGESMPLTLEALRARLLPFRAHAQLGLSVQGRNVLVLSNSERLLDVLSLRLSRWVIQGQSGSIVEAIQAAEPVLPLSYNRRGVLDETDEKAEFCDLEDGQVVRAMRSGLHFFLGTETRKVLGNCLAHPDHVARFILNVSPQRWKSVAETTHEQTIISSFKTEGEDQEHGNRYQR